MCQDKERQHSAPANAINNKQEESIKSRGR